MTGVKYVKTAQKSGLSRHAVCYPLSEFECESASFHSYSSHLAN